MNKFIISLALVAAFSSAVTADHDPAWSDFRGSFLIGKNESFAPFPKTLNDTLTNSENWVQVGNDCSNGGLFNGFQYVKQDDYSVALLFDVNGIIAGIQMLIKKSVVNVAGNPLNYNAVPTYQNATYAGEDYYVLTAYFVEPSTICTTGRSTSSLAQDGTGTGVWLQNGPTPADLLEMPLIRPESEDENENGKWTKNGCFPAMGHHNFYSIDQYYRTNCTEMVPAFGLYNKNSKQLHGFGLITVGNLTQPRFEHPPEPAIRLILTGAKTPQCVVDMANGVGVTSLHVYFTEEPWKIGCPIIETAGSYADTARRWIKEKIFG
jgi:charged multivesicular body protein 7